MTLKTTDEIELSGMGISGFTVRRATKRDVKGIHYVELNAQPTPWSKDVFSNELDVKISKIWVVENTIEIAAFLVVWNVHDELHILNIAVHEKFRRLGIASALISELKKQAQRTKKTVISLEVRASNNGAQTLYAGLGFEKIGRRKAYYADTQEDAIILACIIEESDSKDF